MKRVLAFITGSEWAMFCSVVTAILAELPGISAAVQGELNNGEWTPMGLIVLVMGFAIRSNVWKASSVRQVQADAAKSLVSKAESDLRFLAARDESVQLRMSNSALEAALEAARQGASQDIVGVPVLLEQPQQPGEPGQVQ